jgi:hypothetical protein
MNWLAKSACSAASLLFPIPGGPRQPPDRQLSYYSEPGALASQVSRGAAALCFGRRTLLICSSPATGGGGGLLRGGKKTPDAGKPPPREWLRNPAIVTGLPVDGGRWLLPPRLSRLSRSADPLLGAAHWAVAHAGRPLLLGWPGKISGSRNITGAYSKSNCHAVCRCF